MRDRRDLVTSGAAGRLLRGGLAACAVLVMLATIARTTEAQSPEWNAFLNVRPDPSPYIADWEADPTIVTLVLSYSGSSNVAFHLDGSIVRGGTALVGGKSTAFEFVR